MAHMSRSIIHSKPTKTLEQEGSQWTVRLGRTLVLRNVDSTVTQVKVGDGEDLPFAGCRLYSAAMGASAASLGTNAARALGKT